MLCHPEPFCWAKDLAVAFDVGPTVSSKINPNTNHRVLRPEQGLRRTEQGICQCEKLNALPPQNLFHSPQVLLRIHADGVKRRLGDMNRDSVIEEAQLL